MRREVLRCAGWMEMENTVGSGVLRGLPMRKMKNLIKCDYGWVQESNDTDTDVGDTCMFP